VEISRPDAARAVVKFSLDDVATADDFRLLYSTDASPVGLNVISYKPDDKEDGYFALLATPDTRAERTAKLAKTMLFLCDRSGSMSGPKIAQVKSALQFLLRQLDPADTFNIVAYDSEVEGFRPELQRANAGHRASRHRVGGRPCRRRRHQHRRCAPHRIAHAARRVAA
jgi:Ca-activated chloride channel family protein